MTSNTCFTLNTQSSNDFEHTKHEKIPLLLSYGAECTINTYSTCEILFYLNSVWKQIARVAPIGLVRRKFYFLSSFWASARIYFEIFKIFSNIQSSENRWIARSEEVKELKKFLPQIFLNNLVYKFNDY